MKKMTSIPSNNTQPRVLSHTLYIYILPSSSFWQNWMGAYEKERSENSFSLIFEPPSHFSTTSDELASSPPSSPRRHRHNLLISSSSIKLHLAEPSDFFKSFHISIYTFSSSPITCGSHFVTQKKTTADTRAIISSMINPTSDFDTQGSHSTPKKLNSFQPHPLP